MPTYKQIIAYVKNEYGYTHTACWIGDVKRKLGYPIWLVYNKKGDTLIKNPCPAKKFNDIKKAFDMLKD